MPTPPSRKPFSVPVLHIMLALAEGPRHGYAIKQEVETRTRGEVRLGPSTLYEAIQRLEDDGLIESVDPAEPANGQQAQRRYYALSAEGWAALQDEIHRLGAIVDRARAHPKLRKGLA